MFAYLNDETADQEVARGGAFLFGESLPCVFIYVNIVPISNLPCKLCKWEVTGWMACKRAAENRYLIDFKMDFFAVRADFSVVREESKMLSNRSTELKLEGEP